MNIHESATVDRLILRRLDAAGPPELPEKAADLILAALLGEQELADALGGAAVARPHRTEAAAPSGDVAGTYLSAIEVRGFRGIGELTRLDLTPGPGLTIVAGRNGSGKSSFAEAAELAFTGDNKRWAGRPAVWREGWRNLHTTKDPLIRVHLGVEGHRNGATVECHWRGEGLADRTDFLQRAGQARQSVADLGWTEALELYRPFLSYSELGGMLSGRPSEIHDSLQRILGLGRLVEIEALLKAARHQMDELRHQSATRLPALREALAGHDDPRAREAESALAVKTADLDRLEAIAGADSVDDTGVLTPLRQLDVLDLPDRARVAADIDRLRAAQTSISESEGTPAAEARALAGLISDALRHHEAHPDQPCPVCAGRTLDEAWAAQARARLEDLTGMADRLDRAHREVREASRTLLDRLPVVPAALDADLAGVGIDTGPARSTWRRWDDLVRCEDHARIAREAIEAFDALVAALEPVQLAARQELARRHQAWQPLAEQIRSWVDSDRNSRRAAEMHAALHTAIGWLRGVGADIRDEKMEPVAAEATRIWNLLRQESSVELGKIKLAGAGPARHVAMDVSIDGTHGAALGVMSQGELHSLALALFLPRATMPQSPFRFLLIDDPVQSMDPAKVHGLAEVLHKEAEHRQVIVFTHDDRLPAAVRHLGLKARILAVSRAAHSRVAVEDHKDGDPARRYLDDARAITKDDQIADGVATMVVANLLRDAIEYACHERIRIRDLRSGTPVADTDEAIGEADNLRKMLALTLLGSTERVGELGNDKLQRLHPTAPDVVKMVNRAVHGSETYNKTILTRLINNAARMIEGLRRP